MNIPAGLTVAVAIIVAALPQQPETCVVPVIPAVERPQKPVRPAVPACVNQQTNRHTCSNRVVRELDAAMATYEASFNNYVATVNAYSAKLAAYVVSVNAYVQCEQRTVIPTTLIQG